MGLINLTETEKLALSDIDERELHGLIDRALQNGSPNDLYRLPLSNCGPYVATKLRRFDEVLGQLRDAKSAKKREQKRSEAWDAGSDLSFAFGRMKSRMETEVQEAQLFYVDDQILRPYRFTEKLQVAVSYRWRPSVEDQWSYGGITFHHNHSPRPDYTLPRPKRKPSAAKQYQSLQDELSRRWEHLVQLALCSVRDFFKNGGDGSKIPSSFQVIADQHTSGLNNFSAVFWREQS